MIKINFQGNPKKQFSENDFPFFSQNGKDGLLLNFYDHTEGVYKSVNVKDQFVYAYRNIEEFNAGFEFDEFEVDVEITVL